LYLGILSALFLSGLYTKMLYTFLIPPPISILIFGKNMTTKFHLPFINIHFSTLFSITFNLNVALALQSSLAFVQYPTSVMSNFSLHSSHLKNSKPCACCKPVLIMKVLFFKEHVFYTKLLKN
jgi:hypothetical protein